MKAIFYTSDGKRIGTYVDGIKVSKADAIDTATLTISELAIGGLDAVSGFTPTKFARGMVDLGADLTIASFTAYGYKTA